MSYLEKDGSKVGVKLRKGGEFWNSRKERHCPIHLFYTIGIPSRKGQCEFLRLLSLSGTDWTAAVREGSLSLVHQKPSSTKAARSVLVSPKRRKEGHERHREDSRTRHDSDPGKFDLHWPCCPQIDYSPLKVKPVWRQVMVSGIGHRKGRRGFKVYYGSGPLLVVIPRSHGWRLTFSIGIEGCADQFDFSLCHLEIVCPELGYGVGRECQYISSSSSKAKISINSIILPLFASEAVSKKRISRNRKVFTQSTILKTVE